MCSIVSSLPHLVHKLLSVIPNFSSLVPQYMSPCITLNNIVFNLTLFILFMRLPNLFLASEFIVPIILVESSVGLRFKFCLIIFVLILSIATSLFPNGILSYFTGSSLSTVLGPFQFSSSIPILCDIFFVTSWVQDSVSISCKVSCLCLIQMRLFLCLES